MDLCDGSGAWRHLVAATHSAIIAALSVKQAALMGNFGGMPFRALLVFALLLSVSSCGQRDGSGASGNEPPAAIGIYEPADAIAESWGAFDYYSTHATFAAFQGHLSLEDAGRMPAAAGEDLAGAQVFRITNAAEHFQLNRGRDGTCLSAPRWLVIKNRQADGGSQRILVALLMTDAFANYAAGKPGFCGGAVYSLS